MKWSPLPAHAPRWNAAIWFPTSTVWGGQGYETINTRCTLLVVAENPGRNQLDKAARWHVPTITWEEWWERAFNCRQSTKPKPAEDDIVSLDQYASLIHNAA